MAPTGALERWQLRKLAQDALGITLSESRCVAGCRRLACHSLATRLPLTCRAAFDAELCAFFICWLYSVDVMQTAKGAYLEIISSFKY
jgi:hypothetical protein